MKKFAALTLAALVAGTVTTTAFAADHTVTEADDSPKSVESEITTSITPTYTVTIPANVTVDFNALSTTWGKIEVTAAQIDPDKCIKVSLTSDGTLENQVDAEKVIPYTVKTGEEAFTSATYLKTGDNTPLTIDITQEDWNKAYAGNYSDTVTFEVSYIDINAVAEETVQP